MTEVFEVSAILIGRIGMAIIAISSIIGLFSVIVNFKDLGSVRKKFGERILTGLEFVIAGELILVTITTDIGGLLSIAVIVAIRAVLGFILRKEIEEN